MSLKFSTQTKQKIDALIEKYPTKMALTLPALWLAQEELGVITPAVIELVAETLDVAPSHVHGVATFYTMYNKKPVGRLHIQVCTNVSCMICGAYDLLREFESQCGLKAGETNEDFTLQEVECLAACGSAPMVQINDTYYEPIYPKDVPDLVEKLLAEAKSAGAGSQSTEATS